MATETVRVEGLEGVLEALKSLPAEIVSRRGGPVAQALRAGGRVFLKEARQNIQHIIDEPNIGGKDNVSRGELQKALGVVRDRHPESIGVNERAIVKVRKAKSRYSNLSPAQYGAILEHGSERQTAKPWLTPAYYSRRDEAMEAVVSTLKQRIDVAIAKAAAIGRSMP